MLCRRLRIYWINFDVDDFVVAATADRLRVLASFFVI